RSTWCGADAQSSIHIAQGGFAKRAIHGARVDLGVIPAAAARNRRTLGLDRARPLPDVAGDIIGADRALRRRVRANLVEAEPEWVAAVGRVDVGVVRTQRAAAGEYAAIGPTRRAFPFVLVAQPRAPDPPGAVEPCGKCYGILVRYRGDRK